MNKKSNNEDFWQSSTFKGLVAVLITLLLVVIIVLVCAKLLFVGGNTKGEKKTGRITVTESHSLTTTTAPKTEASKITFESTTGYNDAGTDNSIIDGAYTVKTVISAVYLHPQPTSASENLCVIPVGAECKVYTNENGWLYLDYNGQKGYAYHSFFTE